jgi:hypothetical protein
MAGTDPHVTPGEERPEVRHERSDVNVRAILWFAGGLTVAAVVIHIGLWALFAVFAKSARGTDVDRRPLAIGELQRPPEPRLQALPWERGTDWAPPRVDLGELRAAEDRRLHSYGWVDRRAGTVHIPVERAIELLAARGLPSRPDVPGSGAGQSITVPAPTDAASGQDSRAIQTPRGNSAPGGSEPR